MVASSFLCYIFIPSRATAQDITSDHAATDAPLPTILKSAQPVPLSPSLSNDDDYSDGSGKGASGPEPRLAPSNKGDSFAKVTKAVQLHPH